MPASPYVIRLDDAGRAEPESVSRRGTAPHRLVLRARIILLAAGGLPNSVIAARLGICQDTARKWRRRYCEQGPDGLADAPRPGRPRKFPARVVAEVKALACELPAASGKPLARWTCPELARQAAAGGIVAGISASTVRCRVRVLRSRCGSCGSSLTVAWRSGRCGSRGPRPPIRMCAS